jgi:beta-N-acetylglucosaminidase
VNTTIVDFGDEDKAIIGGTTYIGADGRTALTNAGFTLVNHWI